MKLKFRAEGKDLIIFLIFCLLLLYLVAIAVLNIRYVYTKGYFFGLNPFPAFSREFIFYTIFFYVIALVAIIVSTSSFFITKEEGIGFTTKKKKDKNGYSKVLSEKDMKKEKNIVKVKLNEPSFEGGGIPVINDGKYMWVDNSENHSLIMGASGSGKTQNFMFPLIRALAKHGESIIVTDPKGELYEGCGNLLKDNGYKVILINFRDPEEGEAWNPFSYPYRVYKSGNVDKANELLQDLATNILIDPNNRAEPFWETTSANFFTGLALGLFDDAEEEEININSINMMAEVGDDRVGQQYMKDYFRSKGELSPAYISASSCINAPADTRGGIMSTFRTKTRIFSSQQRLSEMLSYSDFDIRDIGREKTAVFLKVHDEKTTYHALATIFVKQVYEALIGIAQEYPNLKLPYRTNFVLDEFANMPPLKDVEAMITASRSRNIRFNFAIQNFSQLNKVYGKEVAETIKGNCGNFVYIMTTELAALEEVSKLLGDKEPKKPKKDEQQEPIRPLFSVSDLQALDYGEVIINRFRSMPFKTKLKDDYKIDWGKKYPAMPYEKRTPREVKVFNIKAYVDKLRNDPNSSIYQGGNGMMSSGMMGLPNGMKTPTNPFMMGANPFAMPSNNPFVQNNNPFVKPSSNPSQQSLDDYVKMLDKKIAELEEEERIENEKKNGIKEVKENTSENSKNAEHEIEEILNNFVPTPKETNIESKEVEKIDLIEKPLLDTKIASKEDEEFFKDFFGDEE